jgi:hypothetical protein
MWANVKKHIFSRQLRQNKLACLSLKAYQSGAPLMAAPWSQSQTID